MISMLMADGNGLSGSFDTICLSNPQIRALPIVAATADDTWLFDIANDLACSNSLSNES
jgi:hypothetical protein